VKDVRESEDTCCAYCNFLLDGGLTLSCQARASMRIKINDGSEEFCPGAHTHEDPPTLQKVDDCYYRTVGSNGGMHTIT
jgi:hypothetical protein